MDCVANPHESLAQIDWHRLGVALSFRPPLALASQISINVSLIAKVIRYGAVNLFETKKLKILTDGLGGLASTERVDDRIQGNSCARNIVVAATLLNVILRHACLIVPS